MDIPTEQLLDAGVVGVVCLTILIALAMVLRARKNKNDDEPGPPMALLFAAFAAVALGVGGCVSAPASEYVELDRRNFEATAPLLEDLIENARRDHNATAMLPDAIAEASALLAQADASEDPAEANTLRLAAAAVLRDATTVKYFPPEEAAIWRDGIATWLARLEAAEALTDD